MSKKTIETLIKISNNITTKIVKGTLENPIPGKKWKVEVEGEFKDMSSNNNGFSKKQMEQLQWLLQPIVNRLDGLEHEMKEVKNKIENVDKEIKEIKNTPTIKRELKK
ncbi:MAG: hypothetical protein HDR43_03305 [Mycoplasma sp.]|nr:hypothetical protein [Mycoplasma sp.]